ncbi:hypothetical protein R2R35_05660 [Anaerocolumna sp. AGMB13020]|uniref:hypothetical protein n=1 Tax=Anaerocolumna sp. AGMB13020 TaxID=3081750 RepID=UPI002954A4A5|nr:hypothetical protein [Anaerocolumna sp. AGMB13020]WOO37990.1 hypothetical protein R2R35_05660 [Anaerocolumna sp. AGMB13020]
MKEKKNKWLRRYDEKSYEAFIRCFSSYIQYFPYCEGWIPAFYDTETSVFSNLPDETKESRHNTK